MIACLGWGSLIWGTGTLPVGDWQCDGPSVRVEFLRQSRNRRLTLVLHASAEPVSSLWAHMTVDSLDNATKALAKRESIPIKNAEKDIGCWSSGCEDPPNIIDLGSWASERGIDHVIWTALGPKFADKPGDAPTEDQAIEYLNNLSGDHRSRAEKYVRCAPQQICTAYRLRIERCLGWTPVIRKK